MHDDSSQGQLSACCLPSTHVPPSKQWIVHLEGGGWCIDLADCLARSKTYMGSSKTWAPAGIPTMDGGAHGIFNPDKELNPTFFDYTMVCICICICMCLCACGRRVHSSRLTIISTLICRSTLGIVLSDYDHVLSPADNSRSSPRSLYVSPA
jgi:hypothetical protein